MNVSHPALGKQNGGGFTGGPTVPIHTYVYQGYIAGKHYSSCGQNYQANRMGGIYWGTNSAHTYICILGVHSRQALFILWPELLGQYQGTNSAHIHIRIPRVQSRQAYFVMRLEFFGIIFVYLKGLYFWWLRTIGYESIRNASFNPSESKTLKLNVSNRFPQKELFYGASKTDQQQTQAGPKSNSCRFSSSSCPLAILPLHRAYMQPQEIICKQK